MPKVKRKRRVQKGGVVETILKSAKLGYELGKSKDYRRMGRSGVKGTYKPATGGMTKKERAAFNKWRYAVIKNNTKTCAASCN